MPASDSLGSLAHPRILIAIPSYRRPDRLKKLLMSLETQQSVEEYQIEVFVADNDPANHEAFDVCRGIREDFRWSLTCSIVEERGIAAVRNALLAEARTRCADFIAMIDD